MAACKPTKQASVPNKFEEEVKKLETLSQTESYDKNAILFIGSSSIRLWKNINKDLAPLTAIQRGFGGSNFTDVLYYTPRLVYPHSFSAVAVFVGNDIVGSEADKTPEQVLSMFKYFVKLVRKKNKNANIYFIEITPTPSRWAAWPKVNQFNEMVAEYCKTQNKLVFISTKSSFLTEANQPKPELFIADKLHLNDAGYAIWSNIIKNKILETLK
jgi:lysophospholipase L1-like esterase